MRDMILTYLSGVSSVAVSSTKVIRCFISGSIHMIHKSVQQKSPRIAQTYVKHFFSNWIWFDLQIGLDCFATMFLLTYNDKPVLSNRGNNNFGDL